LFTISTGKPVGLWFVQLVSKTSEMGYAIQDWHIAFVQFTFVQFTEWKTRLTSGCFYFYIQVLLFILEIFCLGKTKIALPFTVQPKLHFFFEMANILSQHCCFISPLIIIFVTLHGV